MLIHAYRRKDPTEVELFGQKIKFAPNEAGHCVAEIHASQVIYRLLSIVEAYKVYEAQDQGIDASAQIQVNAVVVDTTVPIGSTVLPEEIELADDRFVALADVVNAAFERSGMTTEEWNAQSTERRESLFTDEIESLRQGLNRTDEDDLAQEEDERAATAKALADAEAVAAPPAANEGDIPTAGASGSDQSTDEPVSLVLTNDAGETIDLSTWTAKQVRAFAADAEISLPTGNSTPVADLRQMLAKGLIAKAAQ